MTKQILIIGLLSGLLGILGCNFKTNDKTLKVQTNSQEMKVSGCDLWEFRNGKVTRKNSYWKIVEPTMK